MSTLVKNIQVREYPISAETKELCKKIGVLKYIPVAVPSDVSFELHNTTTELANALRRCINSELEVLILDFEDNDIDSDDSFIILHELKKRINYIPIRQISGITFSINVYNNTDEIIPVYSSSIKENDGRDSKNAKEKSQGKESLFSGTFIITYLRPGKKIVIKNIHTISGTAYKNHAAFSFPGKVGYRCLELEEKKDGDEVPSSMSVEPTSYELIIPRQKYIDPMQIIKMALKTIYNKLDVIYKIVVDADKNHYSLDMEIVYAQNKGTFKIMNETYTIGNLLSRYSLKVDETITNAHCIKLHPSFNYVTVEIHHATPQKIMTLAIEMIRKELDNIGKSF